MTAWEKKIIDTFIGRYSASSAKAGAAAGQRSLRLRSVSVFPGFDTASPDDKESYLEAAVVLERQGLLILNWEKWKKGERLKTLTCTDCEKLFEKSGKKSPQTEAEKTRAMIRERLPQMEAIAAAANDPGSEPAKVLAFLKFFGEDFSAADINRGMDSAAPADLVRLMEAALEPAKLQRMSTRALSIQLYRDSKRLEYLLALAVPFLSRAQKKGVPAPDLSYMERSFPETMIAGKLVFEIAPNGSEPAPPLVNAEGFILGLPLSSVLNIKKIKTITANNKPMVLTIENKETFFALTASGNAAGYDCYLYTSGYPNRAVAAIIKLLAAEGFSFFHAGDLDPDGILILQSVSDIAKKPVTPLRMDAATFDRYLPWARPVANSMRHLAQIREDTKTIPELAGLIRRIEETSRGVEQEIIDYR